MTSGSRWLDAIRPSRKTTIVRRTVQGYSRVGSWMVKLMTEKKERVKRASKGFLPLVLSEKVERERVNIDYL